MHVVAHDLRERMFELDNGDGDCRDLEQKYDTFDALKWSPRGWQMICRAARTASRFCSGSAAEENMSVNHLDTALPSQAPACRVNACTPSSVEEWCRWRLGDELIQSLFSDCQMSPLSCLAYHRV